MNPFTIGYLIGVLQVAKEYIDDGKTTEASSLVSAAIAVLESS